MAAKWVQGGDLEPRTIGIYSSVNPAENVLSSRLPCFSQLNSWLSVYKAEHLYFQDHTPKRTHKKRTLQKAGATEDCCIQFRFRFISLLPEGAHLFFYVLVLCKYINVLRTTGLRVRRPFFVSRHHKDKRVICLDHPLQLIFTCNIRVLPTRSDLFLLSFASLLTG